MQPVRVEKEIDTQVSLEREATVDVDRGLYILRYTTGAASGVSPVASARPAPGSEPFVEVISAPGVIAGFLSCPGDCVVVRAERSSSLAIKVMRRSVAESIDASFRLEPVLGAERAPAAVSPASAEDAGPVAQGGDAQKLRLLAHVARRGDVQVAAGEWIAGPNAPSAIEGIEIGGDLPAGVQIEVQPLVSTNPLRWLDWSRAGKFAGSRGRALPLAGLRLRLVGEEASRFVLAVDALFLGSAILSKRGREIELVGPAGGDPLIGLRLELAAESMASIGEVIANAPVIADAQAIGNAKAMADAPSFAARRIEPRVKVFRAAVGN